MIGCRWIDAHSLYLLSRRHIRNFGVDNSYCFAVVGDNGSVLFFLKSILLRLLNLIVRVCSQQFLASQVSLFDSAIDEGGYARLDGFFCNAPTVQFV